MKKIPLLRAALMSLIALMLIGFGATAQAVVVESGSYTLQDVPTSTPSALSVGAAPWVDPVFNTPIIRLTDASTGGSNTSCRLSYSYWPVFNVDNTRLAVFCDGYNAVQIFTFNAADFTATHEKSFGYISGDMIWSSSNPNRFFARSGSGGGASYGPLLYSYNVGTEASLLIKDFTSVIPEDYGLNQMSHSMNDNIWAFTVVNTSGQYVGYLVWKRDTDTVLLNQLSVSPEVVDEVQIDKSGRYLNVQNVSGNAQVWDLQASPPTMTQLTWGVNGYYHEDTGYGTLLSACGGSNGICYRQLGAPQNEQIILPFIPGQWRQASVHQSMLADDQAWGLIAAEQKSIAHPFDKEIYQVATDGSGTVRRLVHHYSSVSNYNHNAFGNISRDGRFIAWNSDWGNSTGRTDIYIAKIDDADYDNIPDSIDSDNDNDGVPNATDAFPWNMAESIDSDNDGIGDNADAFPYNADETTDTDSDNAGNNADSDDDNDGILDTGDNCPNHAAVSQLNTDGDAQGDICDMDDDNDYMLDGNDVFPLNMAAAIDTDGDGKPDSWSENCDTTCQDNSGLTIDELPNNPFDYSACAYITNSMKTGVYGWMADLTEFLNAHHNPAAQEATFCFEPGTYGNTMGYIYPYFDNVHDVRLLAPEGAVTVSYSVKGYQNEAATLRITNSSDITIEGIKFENLYSWFNEPNDPNDDNEPAEPFKDTMAMIIRGSSNVNLVATQLISTGRLTLFVEDSSVEIDESSMSCYYFCISAYTVYPTQQVPRAVVTVTNTFFTIHHLQSLDSHTAFYVDGSDLHCTDCTVSYTTGQGLVSGNNYLPGAESHITFTDGKIIHPEQMAAWLQTHPNYNRMHLSVVGTVEGAPPQNYICLDSQNVGCYGPQARGMVGVGNELVINNVVAPLYPAQAQVLMLDTTLIDPNVPNVGRACFADFNLPGSPPSFIFDVDLPRTNGGFDGPVTGDFLGDGKSQMLFTNFNTSIDGIYYLEEYDPTGGGGFNGNLAIRKWVNWGTGVNDVPVNAYDGWKGNMKNILAGDFLGTGKTQLLLINTSGDFLIQEFDSGLNRFVTASTGTLAAPGDIIAGDFLGTGKAQLLLLPATMPGSATIQEFNVSLNQFELSETVSMTSLGSKILVGDFLGTGKEQLLWLPAIVSNSAYIQEFNAASNQFLTSETFSMASLDSSPCGGLSNSSAQFFAFPPTRCGDPGSDGDTIGNACDADDDNDNVPDVYDAYPFMALGLCADGDYDGAPDIVCGGMAADAFPGNRAEWIDTDGDNIGNNTDTDDDADGVLDVNDAFPLDPTESVDTDADGIGNNTDTDDDADGLLDTADNCTVIINIGQMDIDSDGYGNACDGDLNGDEMLDVDDLRTLIGQGFGTWIDTSTGNMISALVPHINKELSEFDQQVWHQWAKDPAYQPGPSGLSCAGTVPCPAQ